MVIAVKTCSACKKSLPARAPDGLCPECLLKAGLPTGVDIGLDSRSEGGRIPFVAPQPAELAQRFPQLEILGLIGQGGMGAVYKARQKVLDRIVALKILPPGIGDTPAFAERFTQEAKALAKLNHPGIVTIHEFGQANGLFYFLMEFVDGVSLGELLKTGRISSREALEIVPQICDALQYAHDTGIVHRDIKPANILMDRKGRVKVADFGLAKLIGASQQTVETLASNAAARVGETAHPTDSGKVVGTPQYMSPEQVSTPCEVDHRADVYALGVVFYQMLTGELPGKPIQPPSEKVQIDVRLDGVVLRALEKKPELRFQQISDIKRKLESIATTSVATGNGGSPVLAPPPTEVGENAGPVWSRVPSRALGSSSPKRAILAAGISVLVVSLCILRFLWWQEQGNKAPAPVIAEKGAAQAAAPKESSSKASPVKRGSVDKYSMVVLREPPDRRDQQLQASFLQFPLLAPATNSEGKDNFLEFELNSPVKIDGVAFYGFRFKVPKRTAQEDFVWGFGMPNPAFNWYIVPQTGSMAGFGEYFREPRAAYEGLEHLFPTIGTHVVLQRLREELLEDEQEYLIWFAFRAQKPKHISLTFTFADLPESKASRATLEAALGLHRL